MNLSNYKGITYNYPDNESEVIDEDDGMHMQYQETSNDECIKSLPGNYRRIIKDIEKKDDEVYKNLLCKLQNNLVKEFINYQSKTREVPSFVL